MPENDYIIYINETTRIFVYYETEKGKVKRFVVKLELLINNEWVEIERYDTHHGFVHKDIIGKDKKKKSIVKYESINLQSGFNMAVEDFKKNYQLYIRRYNNG